MSWDVLAPRHHAVRLSAYIAHPTEFTVLWERNLRLARAMNLITGGSASRARARYVCPGSRRRKWHSARGAHALAMQASHSLCRSLPQYRFHVIELRELRRAAHRCPYSIQVALAHRSHLYAGWSFLPRAPGEFVEVWPAQQRFIPGGTPVQPMPCSRIWISCWLSAAVTRWCSPVITFTRWITRSMHRAARSERRRATRSPAYPCLSRVRARSACSVSTRPRIACRASSRSRLRPRSRPAGASPTVLASMGIYVFTTDYLVAAPQPRRGSRRVRSRLRPGHPAFRRAREPGGRPSFRR